MVKNYISINLKNHSLLDIHLCELLSLFQFAELALEVCPNTLDAFNIQTATLTLIYTYVQIYDMCNFI